MTHATESTCACTAGAKGECSRPCENNDVLVLQQCVRWDLEHFFGESAAILLTGSLTRLMRGLIREEMSQKSASPISHCPGCGEAWNQRAEGLECPRCSRSAPDIRASAESFVEKHRNMLKRLADE